MAPAEGDVKDYASLSNPEEVKAEHLDLQLTLDFDKKVLEGFVEYTLCPTATGNYILDTKDLTIKKIQIDGQKATQWSIGEKDPVFGSPLTIDLTETTKGGNDSAISRAFRGSRKVRIYYKTSPEASACQWVDPASTAGKQYPYFFTQCQAIHARTLLPCQDCPAAKCTYTATIEAPGWSEVLMSAVRVQRTFHGMFTFKQSVPVPSYLIAIVCGQMSSREISGRCAVWSEPSMVEAVAREFSETEEFLKAAEEITGLEYQWGRYDVLCLPPSFPYGGMENPCLTFVTPTLLAGDKSLADVVAHEISHSWTGNVITNHTWTHFWLNEGWTVWLERKILELCVTRKTGDKAKGKDAFITSAQIGASHLKGSIEQFKKMGMQKYNRMVPSLAGVDPDDVFSAVPYEKGFAILYAIETQVGEKAFAVFAKKYIKTYKFKTITAAEFKTFVKTELPQVKLDWEMWYYGEDLPEYPYKLESNSLQTASRLAQEFLTNKSKANIRSTWSGLRVTAQLVCLEELQKSASSLTPPDLDALAAQTGLADSQNSELRFMWLSLCMAVNGGDKDVQNAVVDMATSQGRMKFTRSLYRILADANLPLAKAVFEQHKDFYHPICRTMVGRDLANNTGGKYRKLKLAALSAGLVTSGVGVYMLYRYKMGLCPIPDSWIKLFGKGSKKADAMHPK